MSLKHAIIKNKTLKNLISKNKKLYYLQKCIRKIKDEEFMDHVLSIDKDYRVVRFRRLGDINKDKNIIIIRSANRCGFGARLRFILGSLAYVDSLNLIPVIWMGQRLSNINGCSLPDDTNFFEYYFEQPTTISLSEALSSYKVIINSAGDKRWEGFPEEIEQGYLPNEEYIDSLAKIYGKYVKLNEATMLKIRNERKDIIKEENVLGVHIRGTDFYKNYSGHPIPVTIDQTIAAVKSALEQEAHNLIFLATDEERAVQQFKKVFGARLICYNDVRRSNDGRAIHILNKQSEQINQIYETDYEVLRDIITLSECDGLIAGPSQVSVMARVIKASKEKRYGYINILDNGINYNNNQCPL